MSADGGLFMLILLVVVEVKTIVDLLDGEVGAAPQKGNNWAEQDMIPSAIRLLLLDGLVKAVVEIMTACWIQEQYVCVMSWTMNENWWRTMLTASYVGTSDWNVQIIMHI